MAKEDWVNPAQGKYFVVCEDTKDAMVVNTIDDAIRTAKKLHRVFLGLPRMLVVDYDNKVVVWTTDQLYDIVGKG